MKKIRKLNSQEMIQFCEHMSMILKAGITPADGIEIMLNDTTSEGGKAILKPISEKCNTGMAFDEALRESGVFPKYALNLIEIGNASGNLDEVMDSLAYHYNREKTLAEGIKTSVKYPCMIVFMMLILVIILIVKVMPIFQQVYIQLGTEFTGFSASMLDLGNTLTKYSFVFIAIFVILVVAFLFFTVTNKGKRIIIGFFSKFPLTKGFYEKIAIARFSSAMSLTISAGLDFEKSLDMAESLVDRSSMAAKLKKCRKLMSGDEKNEPMSFSRALIESRIYNNANSKMISIGFTTGSADQVFRKIADSYDSRIEQSMNNAVSVIEPTLVIGLSIVVCLILLSVIMPLMGVMSGIG